MPKPKLKRPVPQPAVADDPGARGRELLALLAKLTADIARQVKLTREHWRAFGEVLQFGKRQHRGNVAYSEWVRANRLDRGVAGRTATRSDALWLHENWSAVLQHCKTDSPHPSDIRQWCREAGFDWARPDDWVQRQWKRQERKKRSRTFLKQRSKFRKAAWTERRKREVRIKDGPAEDWQRRRALMPDEVHQAALDLSFAARGLARTAQLVWEDAELRASDVADLRKYNEQAQQALAVLLADRAPQ